VRPRRYTVGDVLEDSLAHGVDGLSARTVTLYRGTIVKALNEELGIVRLTERTAGNVQGALAAMAPQLSTRTLQIAHNVLVRVIRQAERDDLSACSACSSRCGAVRKNLSLPPKLTTIGQASVQGVLDVLPGLGRDRRPSAGRNRRWRRTRSRQAGRCIRAGPPATPAPRPPVRISAPASPQVTEQPQQAR
jgi:hypothetical protein